MRNVVSRFLDKPIDWGGEPVTDAQKAAIVDSMKKGVNEALTELAQDRLQKVPLPKWQAAYGLSGKGSTYERKGRVRSIFRVQVPVPESISDRLAQAWIETIDCHLPSSHRFLARRRVSRKTGIRRTAASPSRG